MDALLREFQDFWQTNSEAWETRLDYPEAFPHLLLMAFLQRITNGDGRIEREYAAGRGRMDLAVEYNGSWDIIEVKLVRQNKTFETVQAEGKKQILRYRDNFAPTPGTRALRSGNPADCYLVIFDRRTEKSAWKKRLKWLEDGEITVVGC
jgi:RecB family endonuclease NucS